MTLFDLTQRAEYIFIVAGVDADGTEGELSNSSSSVITEREYQSNSNILIYAAAYMYFCEYTC